MKNLFQTMAVLAFSLLAGSSLIAQTFNEKFEHWPVNLKINGTIIVDNGIAGSDDFKALFRRAKDKQAVFFFHGKIPVTETTPITASMIENQVKYRMAKFTSDETRLLDEALKTADIVGVLLGDQADGDDHAAIVKSYKSMDAFLKRGGTLLVDGAAAKALAKFYVGDQGQLEKGNGLLPDCAISVSFENNETDRRNLLSILARHPRSVGVGIEKKSAMILSGRKIRVVGEGETTFMLMANERQPLRVQTIGKMTSRRQPPEKWLVDLTEWRRDAIDRTLPMFPAAKPEKPFVENGTLVIVGGGGMPRGLMDQIVEMAGGKEKAKMVYIPCSERDDVGEQQRTVAMWERMGVKHATFIHTKDRNRANSDEDFLEPLKDATGLWFGGGRQWNFADSYYGTQAHRLMKEVLKRGGVIGGSSAGASIQGRYLARATPIGNFQIMAPGYERGGLGFISGVAIDQHFSQRGRQKDMTQLVNRYPQLLGIGLDEATAIIVRQSEAEVVGRGKVFFYNRELPVFPGKPDYLSLPAGSKYDLANRKVLKEAEGKNEPKPAPSKSGKDARNDGN